MTLLFISFFAGVLTVLAPCILPLLPVIIGSSVGARSKATPYIVIGSLAVSILVFTFLLKVSTAFISIPPYVWSFISGGILVVFGLVLLFPKLWEKIPLTAKTSVQANKLVGAGYKKKSIWGDVLIGAALGPVFSSCSPTYFVILATVLPASFLLGTVYLLAYIAGLVLVLLGIALLGQRLITPLTAVANSHGIIKRLIGGLFILIGLLVFTGFDKKLETRLLDSGYLDGILNIETSLLEGNTPSTNSPGMRGASIVVPRALQSQFPLTDFSRADVMLEQAVSGGPGKDGIPAIDAPQFLPLADSNYPDDVQAIVMQGTKEVRVYPYNILTWHEIVNDNIDEVPVAITFCPLCGSAIVFNRTLPNGSVSTLGVSGSLLESNMIMYDRTTESLWQQSTGAALAGSQFPGTLALEAFQLLTFAEIRATYPNALVLSEETGYARNYQRNPYAGYDENEQFIFSPSNLDTSFPPKTIMAVFRVDSVTFATPWLALRSVGQKTIVEEGVVYTLTTTDMGELTITDDTGTVYPFYFEMWFSVAVQNSNLIIIE